MHDAAFVDAHVPEPFTVLGVRLKPLSLGHVILLHKIESPFVLPDGGHVSLGDLAASVFICGSTWKDALQMFEEPQAYRQWAAKWGRRITRGRGWRKWLPWHHEPIQLAEKVQLFSQYLEENYSAPEYLYNETASETVEAPSWQLLKVTMLAKLGLSDAEVMDRSYRQCMVDFLTLRAMEGQIRFSPGFGDQYKEALEMANKLQAQIEGR